MSTEIYCRFTINSGITGSFLASISLKCDGHALYVESDCLTNTNRLTINCVRTLENTPAYECVFCYLTIYLLQGRE